MCDAFIIKVMLKIKEFFFRLKFPNDKFKKIYMQASIYFFSHAFTIILMNCNVCILQLQKKTTKKNEKKQNKQKPQTKPKKKIKKNQNISRHLTV